MAKTLHEFQVAALSGARLADAAAFAATRAVAIDLTGEVRASIRRAAPGERIKGKRGKPVKVGAAYTLNQAKNTGLVFARGPLQLVENDTKAHPEPRIVKDLARQARTAKQRRTATGQFVKKGTVGGLLLAGTPRKRLRIPGIGIRRSVKHPGTKGKHPFKNAVDEYEASDRAARIYASQMRRVLKKVAE